MEKFDLSINKLHMYHAHVRPSAMQDKSENKLDLNSTLAEEMDVEWNGKIRKITEHYWINT